MSDRDNKEIDKKEIDINKLIENKIKEDKSNEYEYIYNYKLVVIGCAGATVELDSIKKIVKKSDNIKKN